MELQEKDSCTDCSCEPESNFSWPETLKNSTSFSEREDGERCSQSDRSTTASFSCGRVDADDYFRS